ncbi:hypothetical protein B0H14DRAFT_3901169 [Mycena olivaceomarginata]|nr:hypothetical protein B0H14DRAFT_3901169 [Mycena olivaceomarginata]
MERRERKYTSADLVGLKRKELVAIIQSQPTKWPAQAFGKFNQQKTNMDKMKQALVSEDSEFTTTEAVERPVTPRLKNTIPPPALQTTRPSGIPQAPASSATVHPNVPVDIQQLANGTTYNEQSGTQNLGTHSILLLIEDTRSMEKISQRIQVPAISSEDLVTGEWQASSHEIVNALQTSISAFKGPARIGMSDPENEGYTVFFATITGPEYLGNEIESGSILLTIPRNQTLKLTISDIGGAKIPSKRRRSESPPSSETVLPSTQPDTEPTPATSTRKKRSTVDNLTEGELSWIQQQAAKTPGFVDFKQRHNQRLDNPTRVSYWKFAAAFCSKYYKAQWPSHIDQSSGKTIRKNAIEVALGMGTTMLAQAIQMARIVSVYCDGPHRAPEVVEKLDCETSGSDSSGSESLADFLTRWEKDHPVQASTL